MAKNYLKINNYSPNGSLYISSKVFKDIAVDNLLKTDAISFDDESAKKKPITEIINKKVSCSYKDGRAELYINIAVKKGYDVNNVCLTIQKRISDEIFTLLEQVPVKIKIKVEKIV